MSWECEVINATTKICTEIVPKTIETCFTSTGIVTLVFAGFFAGFAALAIMAAIFG
jgi:hypothetical protein